MSNRISDGVPGKSVFRKAVIPAALAVMLIGFGNAAMAAEQTISSNNDATSENRAWIERYAEATDSQLGKIDRELRSVDQELAGVIEDHWMLAEQVDEHQAQLNEQHTYIEEAYTRIAFAEEDIDGIDETLYSHNEVINEHTAGIARLAASYKDTLGLAVDGADLKAAASVREGSNGVAIGANAKVTGDHGVAAGAGAVATGDFSAALGAGAKATAEQSVALGADSIADEAGTVSVGTEAFQRRVTNVADGIKSTDAATVGQMNFFENRAVDRANSYTDQRIKTLDKQLSKGIAATAALQVTTPYAPGKIAVNAGVATYRGNMAVGVAVSRWNVKGNFNVNAGVATAGSNSTVARAGVGFLF